ncbi:hypothetical protein GIB67_040191, partial [Kingdonia uniflora]
RPKPKYRPSARLDVRASFESQAQASAYDHHTFTRPRQGTRGAFMIHYGAVTRKKSYSSCYSTIMKTHITHIVTFLINAITVML